MNDMTLEQHVQWLLRDYDIPNDRRSLENFNNIVWLSTWSDKGNNMPRDNPIRPHLMSCLKALLTKDRE